nr:hypothetical protein [Bacillus sp. FJAT-27445]
MAPTFKVADRKKCSDIVALYDEVTLQVQMKGIHQWDYPWREDIVKEAIDRHEVYTSELGGIIVGAFWIGRVGNFSGLQVGRRQPVPFKDRHSPNLSGAWDWKRNRFFLMLFSGNRRQAPLP